MIVKKLLMFIFQNQLILFKVYQASLSLQQNKGMIEGQKYKEFIQQHGEIQKNIAEGWGYEVNSNQFIPKKQKIPTKIKVANIQPLKHLTDLPISKKLQKIEEELLMIQNQRRLNQLTQQAKARQQKGEKDNSQESTAVRMMHQLIDQYNFMIEHRHIAQKKSDKARKILGIQKTAAEEISEQIEQLRQKICKSNFADMIDINNKIAELYKKYQQQLFVSKSNSEATSIKNSNALAKTHTNFSGATNSFIHSSKLSPGKKSQKERSQNQSNQSYFSILSQNKTQMGKQKQIKKEDHLVQLKDLVIMQELNQSEQGDSAVNQNDVEMYTQFQRQLQPQSLILQNCLFKMQRRTSQYVTRKRLYTVLDSKQRQKQLKRDRMNTTIAESFDKTNQIEKGKRLDKSIRDNLDVIEVWKHRIGQNLQKNRKTYIQYQPKAKQFKTSLKNTLRNINNQTQKLNPPENLHRPNKLSERIRQVKEDLALKQKVFSTILSKKQSKFIKIPGTKIMTKNDVSEIAKNYLGISKRHHSNSIPSQSANVSQNLINKMIVQDTTPEWLNISHDQSIYWSMCRNEKLNLLLKNHKKE